MNSSKNSALIISRFIVIVGFILLNFWLFIVPVLFDDFKKGLAIRPSTLGCSLFISLAILIFNLPRFRKVFNFLLFLTIFTTVVDLTVNILYHTNTPVHPDIRILVTLLHDQVMSELSAFCILLFTLGLILASGANKSKIAAQLIFHTITAVSFLAFTGHVFKVSELYQPVWVKLSFNGCIAFFILSTSASFLNFKLGIPGLLLGDFIGNKLARKLIPVLSVSLLLLGVLHVQSREAHWVHPAFGTAIFTITFMVLGLLLIWRASLWLNEIDIKRQRAESETKSINENLERLVAERTNELRASYQQLEAQEKKLRANERLMSSLLENTSNLVFFKDTAGKYEMVNRSFQKQFNITTHEIIHKTDFDFLHHEEAAHARTSDNRVLSGEKLVTYQYTYNLPTGSHTLLINKFPLIDETENLWGVGGIATDITELTTTRKQLHETSELLAKIFDPSPMGLAIFDPESKKYLQVNSVYCQIFGKEKHELEGQPATEGIVPLHIRQEIESLLAEYGSVHDVEVEIAVNGVTRAHIVSVSPFTAGNRHLLLITMHDISELKKTHQNLIDTSNKLQREKELAENLNSKLHTTILELESTNEKMTQINNNKDRFLAVVSHDLKNPLVGILNLANAIGLHRSITSDLRESLELIKFSGNEMMTLINNLLDLNRMETGTQVLNFENIQISQIFRRIAGSYVDRASKKEIHLRIVNNVDNDTLLTDSIGLYRAIENLVSNAIKFSPKGRQVFVVADEIDQGIRFSIIDEGPGIPHTEMNSMFLSYRKLSPRPTDGESSTGLGLSIVKDWVSLIGGQILVTSQPGVGSTFQIVLPHAPLGLAV